MLYTIAVILLVAWLLGFVGIYTIGSFVHVLLVVALVLSPTHSWGVPNGTARSVLVRYSSPTSERASASGGRAWSSSRAS
jgi:hypothetical protein